MSETNSKLTLSGKSTLTLKNVGDIKTNATNEGKKVVQVEVRRRRTVAKPDEVTKSVDNISSIDSETKAKLELLAQAQKHDEKRNEGEVERERKRALEKEEQAKLEKELAEKKKKEEKKKADLEKRKQEEDLAAKEAALLAASEKTSRDAKKTSPEKASVSSSRNKDDADAAFADRRNVSKRSFEPAKRNQRVNVQAVLDGDDDDYRFGARPRRFKKKQVKVIENQEKVIKEVIIPEIITVQELANRMAEKSSEVIKRLMGLGVMATINQSIDADTAQLIVEDLGHKFKRIADSDVEDSFLGDIDEEKDMIRRAPVVTVMGHVDHGKTSLLDALRTTNVVSREAGGITQHIGAYQVALKNGKKVSLIDTPGHEAFSEMRARGARVTDIVILVVAANDGIMPQTIEAIRHAQAGGVPIVVAINKIDLPAADANKVRTDLLQHGILVEEMGGEVLSVEVSAKKRINIDGLLDAVMLQAEILDLKANPNRKAEGTVVEAKMEKGRGSVATVLVQRGTLKVGDLFVAGKHWGRVRAMFDENAVKLDHAGPSRPVEVVGWNGTPNAGDIFGVVDSEEKAREITNYRITRERDAKSVKSAKTAMEQMLDKIKSGEVKNLPVIIKADVQGSAEAIEGTLNKLSTSEVAVQILHSAVGAISEADVTLAKASNAFIIGFNVRPNPQARDMARRDDVDIRYYSVIYDVADDVKQALQGMLAPELREKILGYAEIRKVFNITGVGKVAGCYITEGMAKRGAKVRLLRDNVVIHDGELGQLKREKDDVREVRSGYECGMSFAHYNDIQEGDFIECYEVETIQRTL